MTPKTIARKLSQALDWLNDLYCHESDYVPDADVTFDDETFEEHRRPLSPAERHAMACQWRADTLAEVKSMLAALGRTRFFRRDGIGISMNGDVPTFTFSYRY
jgi:hypothetical protein